MGMEKAGTVFVESDPKASFREESLSNLITRKLSQINQSQSMV
jgi:hypothetical protein